MDIENATKDPASSFDSPDAVSAHPNLTTAQKIKILEKWKLDAELLATAANESMAGGEPNMLQRVSALLDELERDSND